jgi:hypothetical protein
VITPAAQPARNYLHFARELEMTEATAPTCRDCGRHLPWPEEGQGALEFCARHVAERLAERAESVVEELLPGGRYEGRHWYRCGDISGQSGQSLAVALSGPRRGRFRDYAAGIGGDLLDLIAQVECNGDMRRALYRAHERLRLPLRKLPRRRRHEGRELDAACRRHRPLKVWHQSKPLVPGDPVWRYLGETRQISLERFDRLPNLRFCPSLWQSPGNSYPALVAAIADPSGRRIAAVHRIWLSQTADGRIVKAPIAGKHGPASGAKKSLGNFAGGVVWLTRGASDRPWHDPEPGSTIGLSEGIEDGLTWAAADLELRVAAAVGLTNPVMLPAAITEVLVIGQNDAPASAAAAGLNRLIRHLQRQGKSVSLLRPRDRAVKDVNDLAQRLRARLAG